jgi:hypothetical protein
MSRKLETHMPSDRLTFTAACGRGRLKAEEDQNMSAFRGRFFIAVSLTLVCLPAFAGPCTEEIYQTDMAIGKRLNATAAEGKTGAESSFATMHRQPTPTTVAGAEAKLGELPEADLRRIEIFMDEARKADVANNKADCEKALAEARKILGP